ncbi:uncharacterized protein BDV17DRAFT_11467 [Aspergillus undulatus]|uniref:uncharacterized protein n=1 Tax=Aspergillus undulatus TaxID=1810928 RepID=UPI003CCCF9F9
MPSDKTPSSSSYPSEGKSQNGIVREGGYGNLPGFMNSHSLKMHNDDDVPEAKEIIRRFDEYDRASANDKTTENEKPPINEDYDSDPDSLYGVPISSYGTEDDDEDDSDDGNGCPVSGDHGRFEWGVDEPEFEGYPAFSDDEEGYGSDQAGYGGADYGDGGGYGDNGDDWDDW